MSERQQMDVAEHKTGLGEYRCKVKIFVSAEGKTPAEARKACAERLARTTKQVLEGELAESG